MYNLHLAKQKSAHPLPPKTSPRPKQDVLIRQYQKRVDNFVLSMMAQPITIHQHHDPPSQLTNVGARQVTKAPPFRFRVKSDLINRTEAVREPLPVLKHKFRERSPDKEIQPPMRFVSKTSLDRVQERVKDTLLRDIDGGGEVIGTQLMDKQGYKKLMSRMSTTEKKIFIAREIAKGMLPFLHMKTHFKAVESKLNPKVARNQQKEKGDVFLPAELLEEDREEMGEKKAQQSISIEEQQMLQCSRVVLKKCGLVKDKKGIWVAK